MTGLCHQQREQQPLTTPAVDPTSHARKRLEQFRVDLLNSTIRTVGAK